GNRPRGSGQARRARAHARYRQCRFPRRARAGACAAVRRTTVSWAGVRARGNGRWLPSKEDLVARTIAVLLPPGGLLRPHRRAGNLYQGEGYCLTMSTTTRARCFMRDRDIRSSEVTLVGETDVEGDIGHSAPCVTKKVGCDCDAPSHDVLMGR